MSHLTESPALSRLPYMARLTHLLESNCEPIIWPSQLYSGVFDV